MTARNHHHRAPPPHVTSHNCLGILLKTSCGPSVYQAAYSAAQPDNEEISDTDEEQERWKWEQEDTMRQQWQQQDEEENIWREEEMADTADSDSEMDTKEKRTYQQRKTTNTKKNKDARKRPSKSKVTLDISSLYFHLCI